MNRNKKRFNWDEDEEEVMNEENTMEKEMAPYLNIHAEMPWVHYE